MCLQLPSTINKKIGSFKQVGRFSHRSSSMIFSTPIQSTSMSEKLAKWRQRRRQLSHSKRRMYRQGGISRNPIFWKIVYPETYNNKLASVSAIASNSAVGRWKKINEDDNQRYLQRVLVSKYQSTNSHIPLISISSSLL